MTRRGGAPAADDQVGEESPTALPGAGGHQRAGAAPPHEVYTALLAHELRTPVTAIHGLLELLQDDTIVGDPDTLREFLAAARARAADLARRIAELTTFTRLVSGEPEPPDGVAGGPATLPTMAQTLAAGRPLTVDCAPEAERPAVDLERLRLVLSVLIDNAYRFGTPGTTVRVLAEVVGEPPALSVRVVNEGPAIPAELREAVFQPFRQVEAPDRRTRGGLGLGLNVARRAAESGGGALTLEAGMPTTFRLSLPNTETAAAMETRLLRERLALADAQTLRAIQDIRRLRRLLDQSGIREEP